MNSKKFNMGFVKNWQWCTVLLLLIFSPVSSKLAGACWLTIILLSLWSFKSGLTQGLTSEVYAAKGWLFVCLSALALRAIPQFYWGDSWEERHAEFRLFIGAVGLLAFVQYVRLTSTQLKLLSYAVVLATWTGFALVVSFRSTMLPTNQIPWASSMSLLVCIALALVCRANAPLILRLFYGSGVVVGVCAVLLSEARGAYGIVFWVCGVVLWHSLRSRFRWKSLVVSIFCVLIFITILVELFPRIVTTPAQRIQLALEDFSAVEKSKLESFNTSVGTRLYLWFRAYEEIPDNLLMGIGQETLTVIIKGWEDNINTLAVNKLGHLHNNYINNLLEHGLLGLGSFLGYIGGLVWVGIIFKKHEPDAALGIFGILFVHSVGSITNVNFAHNYYPVTLSIAIFLCFIILTNKLKYYLELTPKNLIMR